MSEPLVKRCDALAERIVLPAFAISREDFLNAPVLLLTRTLDEETRLSISILSALLLFVTRYERVGVHGAVQDPTLKGVYRLLGTGGLLRHELPFDARAAESEIPLAVFVRVREIARAGACDAESIARQVEWGQIEQRMHEAIAMREDQRAMVVSIIRCVLERCVSDGFRAHDLAQERRTASAVHPCPPEPHSALRVNKPQGSIEQ